MRVAAIDLGSVRVGVALSDELGLLAHPRPYLPGRDRLALLGSIAELVQAEGVERVLVGLPRRLDGSQGWGAERARQFAAELARRTGVEVELVDERLTTREASGRLRAAGMNAKRARAHIDSAAAAVFLQSWLDGQAAALRREQGTAQR
jgi:putative holliday junction resolvase